MVTGYKEAIWTPSPNCGELGDASPKRFILIHGSGGGSSAAGVAGWFASTQNQADPANRTSATYVDGLNGEIVQCVDEVEAAWANGYISGEPLQGGIGLPVWGDGIHRDPWWGDVNPNLICISIEVVKRSTDNSDTMTPAQQASLFALVKDRCAYWNIPMRAADATGGITGHFSVDAIGRAHCPGPFPWADLFAYLNPPQGAIHMQPLTFTDDDTQLWHLVNKNIPINQSAAIEQSWLRARWQKGWNFGAPLEAEHTIARGGRHYTEQQFSAARASYCQETGELWWYLATGAVQV